MQAVRKWFCVIGIAALLLTVLPLYVLCPFAHPYYDDFTFAAEPHDAWMQTGSIGAVIHAAIDSARNVRKIWQGTYTGTLLSGLQPGLFSEKLYGIGCAFLLTSFLITLFFMGYTLLRCAGMERCECIGLTAWLAVLLLQWMPSPAEGFYWFNGGIGNLFIVSVDAICAACTVWLVRSRHIAVRGLCRIALLIGAVLLGGGSYSNGVMALSVWLLASIVMMRRSCRRGITLLVTGVVFAVCFAYSISAPGNGIRSGMIGTQTGAAESIAKAVYYGTALIGSWIRLPLIGVSIAAVPCFMACTRKCSFSFSHPVLTTLVLWLLFCSQLTATLFAGVFLGGPRTVNAYYVVFNITWFVWLWYMCGWFTHHMCEKAIVPSTRQALAVLCCAACCFGFGAMATKSESSPLYGIQNMNGVQAVLSLYRGEAQAYDHAMDEREQLLNDPEVTDPVLAPLPAVPSLFMDDLLYRDDGYDTTPSLCLYYHKQSVQREVAQ